MTDPLTPPPERRLPDEVRARMRSELIESTAERTPRRRNGWLVPAVAAAAVAAVVAGATLLLNGGEDGTGGTGLQPAGGGTGTEPTSTVTTEPSPATTPVQVSQVPCAQQMEQFLPGAELASTISHVDGVSALYTTARKWVLCDTWQMGDEPRVTLTAVQPDGVAVGKELFTLYMNFGGSGEAEYGAGGALPDGVTAISYAFPDGHTEQAEITGGMWSMVYLPTSGPLTKGRLPSEPVTVSVTADGHRQSWDLEWGTDTCAQINHGC